MAEFRKHRPLFSKRPPEAKADEETEATPDELAQFYEVLSGLTPERLRFLYKQRWESLRLYPGDIPLLSDAQYLEATLRLLDTWKKQKMYVG